LVREGADEKAWNTPKEAAIVPRAARIQQGRYGVDVLKVEVPVNMKFSKAAELRRQKAYTKKK